MSTSPLQVGSIVALERDQVPVKRATVLVVEDSAFFSQQVGRLFSAMHDLNVTYAGSLSTGFDAIARELPTVILTDLVLPDGDGLELVQRVRAEHPQVQVILMTAYGSEEVVMRALRAGAANYIAKKNIHKELLPLMRQVLEMAAWGHERVRILRCLVRHESEFVLENDPDLLAAFMRLVREELAGMQFWDETGLVQVSIALQEALTNAVFHGNLEVETEHRQEDERVFDKLTEESTAS